MEFSEKQHLLGDKGTPVQVYYQCTMNQKGIFLAKISYKPYVCVTGIDYKVFGGRESIFVGKIELE